MACSTATSPELPIKPTAAPLPWIALYLALVLTPLLVLIVGARPAPGGFAWDFAMALGYAGMAMMGVQFVLTARFRRASAPFGIDILYFFHRYLAVVAFTLLAAHVTIVVSAYPDAAGPLDPRRASWTISVGRVAIVLFAALLVTSLWRRALRLEYDRWRKLHAGFATLALLLGIAHIEGSAQYLHAPLKRTLWTALAVFHLLLIVHVRLLRPWRLRRRPYRVAALREEAGRNWTLRVEPLGHAGFRFTPGQFAWLTLRASPFALREHPFSIASAPSADGALEFTIKELGDFTRTIGSIQVGETAYVDGPFGAFSSERYPQARGLVFIAGGVGIAPIMSMLRMQAARGETRPLLLFYGNRRWDRVLFRDELDTLALRLDLRIVHILGEPHDGWTGERGVLSQVLLGRHLPDDRASFEYLVCGPDAMIRLAEHSLVQLGVPLRRIHSEIFHLV